MKHQGVFAWGAGLFAMALAAEGQRQQHAFTRRYTSIGPGERNLGKRLGNSRYMPHQGERERNRRLGKGCGMPLHELQANERGGFVAVPVTPPRGAAA
jgi:hypothetical protein